MNPSVLKSHVLALTRRRRHRRILDGLAPGSDLLLAAAHPRPSVASVMGKVYDTIEAELAAWIQRQQVFFVATAPLSADGHVNCSPKGGDTFRITGPREVAYLDLTGSGIETIAHAQENGRIVIMFCAFDGAPKIVRLHGRATAVYPRDPDFERLRARFAPHAGMRAIVSVAVARISDSCGYAVPRMDFVEPRDVLDKWTGRKSPEELSAYRAAKNSLSIDGLPGHAPAQTAGMWRRSLFALNDQSQTP